MISRFDISTFSIYSMSKKKKNFNLRFFIDFFLKRISLLKEYDGGSIDRSRGLIFRVKKFRPDFRVENKNKTGGSFVLGNTGDRIVGVLSRTNTRDVSNRTPHR